MNEYSAHLVRAIRGPILLITIGTLFAFDRFTEFRFSQTWPVLLIVAGLLRLVGGSGSGSRRRNYMYEQRHGVQPPPPPAAAVPPPPPFAPPDIPSRRYAESPYRQNRGPEARP
jgi:hypothetical protein